MITTVRLIILFILLSLVAEAQIIRANAFYRPTASASANLLLDDYPNAAVAFSLRKLDKDFTGSAIRVRKDTTGNPEQDIGFDANGNLDTASLKTFLNARSGFVVTWYNQADSSGTFGVRNATQGTAANQGRIALNGVIDRQGSRPCIVFDGTDRYTYSQFTADTIFDVFYAVKRNATTNRAPYLSSTGNGVLFSHWSDNQIYIQYKSVTTWYFKGVSSTSTAFNLYEGFTGGGQNQKIYINNTELTLGARTSFTSNNSNWGSIGAYGNNFPNGTASELILWQSDQQSNRSGISSNINNYYKIYWDGTKDGLLDSFPNAAAAYSVRNLKKSYTGPLVKVRRSSDNLETDIYGDFNGNLDTIGLKDFAGSGDAFITTWYNQGDSTAVNFIQTTAASQPRIVLSGVIERRNGEPTIRFDGTNDLMDAGTSSKFNYLHNPGQAAVFLIAKAGITGNPNDDYNFMDNSYSGGLIRAGYRLTYLDTTGSNNRISSSANIFGSRISLNEPNNFFKADTLALITNLLDNSTATLANRNILYYNGGNEQKLNASNGTATTGNATRAMRLGYRSDSPANPSPLNGYISEIIFYPTDQSSNRTGMETNINNYYGLW